MKKLLIILLIFLCTGGILGLSGRAAASFSPASKIDPQMAEYARTGEWDDAGLLDSFDEDSAEALFLKGMDLYTAGETAAAKRCFLDAEKHSPKDPALPAYLNILLNECAVAQTGRADLARVQQALDELAHSPSVTEQPHWVWYLAYPLTEQKETELSADKLLQRYIQNAEWLSEDEVLQMDSYRAILKNIRGDYSESILLFYDILNHAKALPDSYPAIKTKSVCINYIADMYYSYEDYDRALRLYLELLRQPIEDPADNISLKYAAYINTADIYCRQGDYKQSAQMIAEVLPLLSHLSEQRAAEIRAFCDNISANIELACGNASAAASYSDHALEFLQSHTSGAFFDTEVYFRLTQCRILQTSGEYLQAAEILEKLLSGTIVEQKMRYEAMTLLTELYRLSGSEEDYRRAQEQLLKVQDDCIRQYRSDYCDSVSYYDRLVSLQKEHSLSVQENEMLGSVLFLALVLLALILVVSRVRYRDSITDTLSGLYNRKKLEKETLLYAKLGHKLLSGGVIMCDIDFFKKYNDTYGHAAGDEVIRRVSAVLKGSVRREDIAIRYGGEEFLILLKNINDSTVESIAERIRVNIAREQIRHDASECGSVVSLSIGCFYIADPSQISLPEAIKNADAALYRSKQNGRNRVTVF